MELDVRFGTNQLSEASGVSRHSTQLSEERKALERCLRSWGQTRVAQQPLPRELLNGPRRERARCLKRPALAASRPLCQGSSRVAMDSETRELRALEAEVAALQRECRMLQNPGEKTSGPWYVDRVRPSGPCILAPGGPMDLLTVLCSHSSQAPS